MTWQISSITSSLTILLSTRTLSRSYQVIIMVSLLVYRWKTLMQHYGFRLIQHLGLMKYRDLFLDNSPQLYICLSVSSFSSSSVSVYISLCMEVCRLSTQFIRGKARNQPSSYRPISLCSKSTRAHCS